MGKRGRARARARRAAQPAVDLLVAEIESRGWTVVWVEYCEDTETPGWLGMKAGVTVASRKAVKVRRSLGALEVVAVLAHELEHVDGACWATDHPELGLMCGGRVNGLGEPVGPPRPLRE